MTLRFPNFDKLFVARKEQPAVSLSDQQLVAKMWSLAAKLKLQKEVISSEQLCEFIDRFKQLEMDYAWSEGERGRLETKGQS